MILVFDVDVSKTTSSSRSNTLVNHVDIESAFDSDRDPRGSRRAIPASHLGQCLGLWAVRKMQLKLHRWAGEDSARRFDDLYNLVSDPAFLAHAYERVARNKGARTPGVEKATVAWIESRSEVAEFLSEVRDQLKARVFRPMPVRQVVIPKTSGEDGSAFRDVREEVLDICNRTPRGAVDHVFYTGSSEQVAQMLMLYLDHGINQLLIMNVAPLAGEEDLGRNWWKPSRRWLKPLGESRCRSTRERQRPYRPRSLSCRVRPSIRRRRAGSAR